MSSHAPVTRRVAKIVLSTIKKIGNSRGVTLKKIHDYIRDEYPHTPYNIVKLNSTLQKALAFGAVAKKKNRYVLGNIMKGLIGSKARRCTHIIQAKRRRGRKSRRSGKGRRRRRRRRRSRSSRRRSLRRRR